MRLKWQSYHQGSGIDGHTKQFAHRIKRLGISEIGDEIGGKIVHFLLSQVGHSNDSFSMHIV